MPNPTIQETIDSIESHEWVSQQTGIPASKLRTWHTRNTNGYADLFRRNDFRPPLLRKDDQEVRRWIDRHRVPSPSPEVAPDV